MNKIENKGAIVDRTRDLKIEDVDEKLINDFVDSLHDHFKKNDKDPTYKHDTYCSLSELFLIQVFFAVSPAVWPELGNKIFSEAIKIADELRKAKEQLLSSID